MSASVAFAPVLAELMTLHSSPAAQDAHAWRIGNIKIRKGMLNNDYCYYNIYTPFVAIKALRTNKSVVSRTQGLAAHIFEDRLLGAAAHKTLSEFDFTGSEVYNSICLVKESGSTEKGLRKACRANGIKPKAVWRKRDLIQVLMKI